MSLSTNKKKLIKDIVRDVDGVGSKTAEEICNIKDNISEYNNISISELVETAGDKKTANNIIEEFSKVNFEREIDKLLIEEILYDFVSGQYETIIETSLEDIEEKINILMKEALELDAKELIRFYMYQTVERSASTSWGLTVERICKVAGAEEIPESEQIDMTGKSFDLKKETDEETYYIQIKSGPNTMNVGMVKSLNEAIESVEIKNKNGFGILGMTYGNRSIVSQQIEANLDNYEEKAYIGDGFWELISDESDYMDFLISTIGDINSRLSDEYDEDYSNLLDSKIEELSKEWKQKYD